MSDKSLGAAAGASEPALVASLPEPVPVSAHSGDGQAQDLKPCPYCGGRAELREGEECAYVQCLDASYHRGPFVDGDNNASDEAIAAWNCRAPALLDALSPKEVELVKPPREYEISGDAGGIPAGMVAWPEELGYEKAPADWDCDRPVMLKGHLAPCVVKSWRGQMGDPAIIAYTPMAPAASHDAARDDAAQRLQDHMEQFHGVCLSASEWDAAIQAALPTTDGAGRKLSVLLPPAADVPQEYLEAWCEGQQYLIDNIAATPPTTEASERMREALTEARATFDAMRRGKRVDLTGAVDRCDAALAPSNNEVSGDK